MKLLKETLKKIEPYNIKKAEESKKLWDSLGKPLGSLGKLEEIGIKLSGITGKLDNSIDKKGIIVMASDNGIFEEGVASSPQIFTKILVENTAKGVTGVSTLAKFVNSDVFVVDLGVKEEINNKKVINRKISYGTKNFLKDRAMTYDEAIKAIEIGIEVADNLYSQNYDILGVGELGIANTTTSSAVLTALSGLSVEKTCGVGAGLTSNQLDRKKKVIESGIKKHNPDKNDPIDVISKVGGYDIAAMCGVFLSAAKNKKPVVMDGFISSVSALCAVRLNESVTDYIFPSHLSKETGSKYVFDELGMKPLVDLEMRLGEGSGCPFTFQIIDAALYTQKNIASFEELEIDSSILLDMRNI